MAISKSEVEKLVASGARGQLEARMRILQDPRGYIAQTPDAPSPPAAGAPPAPVAPAAPLVANPPAAPSLSFRERVTERAKTDPLGARAMILANQRLYMNDAEEDRSGILEKLGVASVEEARAKLALTPDAPAPAPVAPVAPVAAK